MESPNTTRNVAKVRWCFMTKLVAPINTFSGLICDSSSSKRYKILPQPFCTSIDLRTKITVVHRHSPFSPTNAFRGRPRLRNLLQDWLLRFRRLRPRSLYGRSDWWRRGRWQRWWQLFFFFPWFELGGFELFERRMKFLIVFEQTAFAGEAASKVLAR